MTQTPRGSDPPSVSGFRPETDPSVFALTDKAVPCFSEARTQRLAEILLHATALDEADRDAFFHKLTGEPPTLLAEARRRLTVAADLTSSLLAEPTGDLLESEAPNNEPAQAPLRRPEDRYKLEDKLGAGGLARVYRAYDQQLGRHVALKFLDHLDSATQRRFLREARSQARVRHDNVLEVYETGELGGTPYIAMRYVEGRTLIDAVKTASVEEKVRLMAQVAEGLHAAHREGLLHHDVKPSNILVADTADGFKPWIADFGLSLAQDRDPSLTIDMAGTPYFMAPERMRCHSTGDRRCDVYSLGVTMYQLFTNELPFNDTSVVDGLRRIFEEEPRPLRALVPALPPEIEAIVLKCMAKDPEARYPSAQAVAQDLRRFLEGEVVEAYAAALAYRLTTFALRNKLALIVAAAASVVLAVGLVIFVA